MGTQADGDTMGEVTYKTTGCKADGLNSRGIKFEWGNPYFGRNKYEFTSSSPVFLGRISEGGGNKATVRVEVVEAT
ncbi:hypothetical protein ACFWDI_06330 [Streptomyces sp. NPDC060064]|uniref:hypothetical protein n=1 Tax=Streptomyces sp. NPDC060064 TaxID=3347049 RepID=UPI00367CD738